MILLWLYLCGLALLHGSGQPLVLSRLTLTATAQLSQAHIAYAITPANRSADVGVQIFAHRDDVKERSQWDLVVPDSGSAPPIISLYQGLNNRGEFNATLKKGRYGACRLLLFASPDGKSVDFTKILYDSNADPARARLGLNLTVMSDEAPVTKPTLSVATQPSAVTQDTDGRYKVTIPASVKVPPGYSASGNGLWAMAKGDVGFSQVWVDLSKARETDEQGSSYRFVPITFTLPAVKPGLWNVQFGLFKSSFGDPLEWVYPGLDFEVGGDSWETPAPAGSAPERLRVLSKRFVNAAGKAVDLYRDERSALSSAAFLRGANYGNALDWTIHPENDRPGYFVLLKGLGCRFVRTLFDPDRYIDQALYRHAVDQVVQNIWAAGLYPVIGPQDLPSGDTLSARIERGRQLARLMAESYKGDSVWLEIVNEPHEFGTWAEWKPVAVQYVRAMRAVDPDAFVVVPFEGWSKDGRGAAQSPITETHVDLYDGHAYVDPGQVDALYGPALHAGLPVLIGEYGGGDPAYLRRMDAALQRLQGVTAVAPWAFTTPGQDKLALVADGSTAQLRFTPTGQVIAEDFQAWLHGRKVASAAGRAEHTAAR